VLYLCCPPLPRPAALAWGLLKQWSLLLTNITDALTLLASEPNADVLVKSFDHLRATFEQLFSSIITN
jgi:hypothetical protein